MAASTTVAMLLADARLPTGGHAHSSGMEPALLGGLEPSAIPEYLIGRALTQSLVEAGTAMVARHRFLRADGQPAVEAVADAWAARTPSRAQREASRLLGRGYLRLAAATWPSHASILLCGRLPRPARPLVLGAIAAATTLSPIELARLVVYDDAQSAAAAALKLVPLDPAIGVRWVLDACARAEPELIAIEHITTPDAIPASSSPESEVWAESHHLLTRRLFRA